MKKTAGILTAVILAIAFLAPSAWSKAEWKVYQTVKPEYPPIDLLVSEHREWIYVLDDHGWISIYASNGQLRDKIQVGQDIQRIQSGPNDNVLFLLSRTKGTIQIITIDVIEDIGIEGSPVKGRPDAPVSIVVFSDFQCPYCARLVPVMEQVFQKHQKDVNIVFKNFPIQGHAFAIKAAQAALAADSQGKFWEFHDLLFKNYNKLSDVKIEEFRSQLGLDAEKFKQRMNDPQVLAKINSDADLGRKAGVRGTPTIFINGRLLRDKSLNGINSAVDEVLRQTQVTQVKP